MRRETVDGKSLSLRNFAFNFKNKNKKTNKALSVCDASEKDCISSGNLEMRKIDFQTHTIERCQSETKERTLSYASSSVWNSRFSREGGDRMQEPQEEEEFIFPHAAGKREMSQRRADQTAPDSLQSI